MSRRSPSCCVLTGPCQGQAAGMLRTVQPGGPGNSRSCGHFPHCPALPHLKQIHYSLTRWPAASHTSHRALLLVHPWDPSETSWANPPPSPEIQSRTWSTLRGRRGTARELNLALCPQAMRKVEGELGEDRRGGRTETVESHSQNDSRRGLTKPRDADRLRRHHKA